MLKVRYEPVVYENFEEFVKSVVGKRLVWVNYLGSPVKEVRIFTREELKIYDTLMIGFPKKILFNYGTNWTWDYFDKNHPHFNKGYYYWAYIIENKIYISKD